MRALFLVALLTGAVLAQDPAGDLIAFARAHCTDCHGRKDPEAGLDLLGFLERDVAMEDAESWLRLRDALGEGKMPPSDEPQPSAADRARAVATVRSLIEALATAAPTDPGRVTMRRLSCSEYARTVFDLCGVAVEIAEFPADDLAYGFDNNGDALTLSPLHLEKYAAAAERIAELALPEPDEVPAPTRRVDGLSLRTREPNRMESDGVMLISSGHAAAEFTLPRKGRYRIRIRAWAMQAGPESARMEVRDGDQLRRRFDVTHERAEPGDYELEAILQGRVEIQAAFVNDYYAPNDPDPAQRDRNLFVEAIEVQGPLDARVPTVAETWLDAHDPGRGTVRARAARVVRELLRRSWRRTPLQREVDRFSKRMVKACDEGESFRSATRLAFAAALLSPHFLFRVEPQARGSESTTPLGDEALATRLAFFLWSSMPDEELFSRARTKRLSGSSALDEEARRMLADPRADALASSFAAQWLELRRLDSFVPDPDRFPSYGPKLARSMRRETESLFLEVLRTAAPVSRLLLAEHTWLDDTLARHYGLQAPGSDEPVRTELEGRRLGGILGHASIHTLTSMPTRTSPVRRGKWLLDQLLDDPPPPPAPGTDSFPAEAPLDTPADLRAQLAIHRARAECAVCHDRIDPLGLALEGFDAIGRARSAAPGLDTSARLPDGRELRGADDLARTIARDPAFARAVLRKLFVYALGREVRPADALVLDGVLRSLPPDPPLSALVLAIPQLDAFRMRSPGKESK